MADEQQPNEPTNAADDQPPATTESGDGFDPVSFVTEGWGGGQATVDDVLDNARVLVDRLRGPVLMAWLTLAACVLTFDIAEAFISIITEMGGGVIALLLTLVWIPFMLVELIVYPLLTVTQFSLFRPLRTRVVEGPVEPDSIKQVFREAWERWVPVAITSLLTSIATFIGLLACIVPGLFFAFLLWMATYLAATRDDLSPIDAMKRSAVLAKKYWKLILVALAAMFVGGLCFGMITGFYAVMLSIIGSQTSTLFSIGAALFSAIGYTVWMFLAFVGMSAVYITVDQAETGH